MGNRLAQFALPLSMIFLQQSALAEASWFSFKEGDGFRRFSVSAGWLHVMPQGKPNNINININTVVEEGRSTGIGDIRYQDIEENSTNIDPVTKAALKTAAGLNKGVVSGDLLKTLGADSQIYGLDQWSAEGTGLKAQDVDALGLVFNYFLTDHVAVEVIGGIPPKVNLKGIGNITAPLHAKASAAGGLINFDLYKDLQITNLDSYEQAASVRAWTPATTLQYHFGQTGVNKFRPYLGLGIMYAWFDDIKLNKGLESDLIAAGHRIQNVLDNKAGAALSGEASSGNPYVKVKAESTLAPFATAGFTYDFNDRWFSTASVSYTALSNKAKISVISDKDHSELIDSETTVDINPVITYLGIGYRF
ncbi:OmpW family protein [Alkanindiges sp. WGS2144]|uniref:OmpW/AlkL family protein n=1 Tax=Alkanindiges sp. WGS2144 TaxID=3366808 RepID=UPI003752F22A